MCQRSEQDYTTNHICTIDDLSATSRRTFKSNAVQSATKFEGKE